MKGGQTVLQSLFEVGVVKLFAESPKRWCLVERASARFADGVAARALCFEQRLAVSLFAIEGMTGLAPGADHQESEANPVHGGSRVAGKLAPSAAQP
jgi:hypothetical protein